jgi:hypothetical protein
MVDVVQAAAARRQKEMITMKTGDDPSVVRWLDEILPLAMQPTPSDARLDLRLYFREGPKGLWLGIEVFDADGKQVGKELPINKPESIGPYFDALAAKAYPVTVGERTKPLQRLAGQSAPSLRWRGRFRVHRADEPDTSRASVLRLHVSSAPHDGDDQPAVPQQRGSTPDRVVGDAVLGGQVALCGQPRAGCQLAGLDARRDVVGHLDVDQLRRGGVNGRMITHVITVRHC